MPASLASTLPRPKALSDGNTAYSFAVPGTSARSRSHGADSTTLDTGLDSAPTPVADPELLEFVGSSPSHGVDDDRQEDAWRVLEVLSLEPEQSSSVYSLDPRQPMAVMVAVHE